MSGMRRLTVRDFIREYKKESPFEIINGDIVPAYLMVAGQSIAARNVDRALSRHTDVGEVFFRLPYMLLDDEGFIRDARLTEVCFVRNDRMSAYKNATPDWPDLPLMIAPDIAVNVLPYDGSVLPSNSKFGRYLENGVEIVWLLYPKRKLLEVRKRNEHWLVERDDILTCDEIMPGFELPLKAIFE
jgi:Uma2 family endonuclease